MLVHIKIINAFGETEIRTQVTVLDTASFDEIDILHRDYSNVYPDCFVNFQWGANFICGQPENMRLDEIKVDRDEMTFDQYMGKWYLDVKRNLDEERADQEGEDMLREQDWN
jgi:hypothetical protein